MTLRPQLTLSDMRAEVFALINQDSTNLNLDDFRQVEALIRRACALLVAKGDWTINRKLISLTLAANTSVLDWPDDVDPGGIIRITAQNTTSAIEWPVMPGISSDDRTAWNLLNYSNALFVPAKYDFQNGQISFGPTNISLDTTVTFEYIANAPADLWNDNQRPNCPAELIIRKAEILLRNHLGMAGLQILMADYADLERTLLAKQGNGKGFTAGSKYVDPALKTRAQVKTRPWWFRDVRP